jgi:protocatechuate 3,4-dioxygenase beta subunit
VRELRALKCARMTSGAGQLFSAAMRRLAACLATATTVAGGLALTASGGPTACEPTRTDAAGPIERLDAPRRAKIGTGHVLQGRILRAGDCSPVRGAVVFLWQAGPNGYVYRPRGRASVVTNWLGRFRFQGPVPASSGFRPPHIHMAVLHPAYEELLTRYVVRRGAKSGRITLVLTPLL